MLPLSIPVLLLAISSSSVVDSFTVVHSRRCENRAHVCFAKTAPKDRFDLDAILEFEEQLKQQQELNRFSSDDGNADGECEDDEVDHPEVDDDDDDIRVYTVTEALHNKRIDAVLSALEPKLSRSLCGNLVTDGCVSIVGEDGTSTELLDKKSIKIEKGTTLRIEMPREEKPTEIVVQNIPLDVIFEDEHMIVLNKASGMVVHPAAGNWDWTVVNALAYYLANDSKHGSGDFVGGDGSAEAQQAESIDVEGTDGEATSFRPGIVHRLDKGEFFVL